MVAVATRHPTSCPTFSGIWQVGAISSSCPLLLEKSNLEMCNLIYVFPFQARRRQYIARSSSEYATTRSYKRRQRLGDKLVNTQLQTRKKATATPLSSFTSVPSGLIQRKCACGGTPGVDDECAECRAKRLSLQRKSDGQSPTPNNASMLPVAGHNFSHVQI